uniref:Uncharacterized protein n=2 Tax=Babesia bovis TaxID=5865 RepID=A7AX04_BABBO|eukprot:XP_001609150.1 hypothetical protein [Babesia bovis T2Bo]
MKEKVNHIFECLDIPPLGSHSSVGEVRSAIELLLELFYRWSHETSKGNTQDVEFMIDLGEVPSGIISEKRTVVTATRILRALHSKELSRLQDEIIWLTERFQQLTANPCTNIKSS